jgi:hypothetical protein
MYGTRLNAAMAMAAGKTLDPLHILFALISQLQVQSVNHQFTAIAFGFPSLPPSFCVESRSSSCEEAQRNHGCRLAVAKRRQWECITEWGGRYAGYPKDRNYRRRYCRTLRRRLRTTKRLSN